MNGHTVPIIQITAVLALAVLWIIPTSEAQEYNQHDRRLSAETRNTVNQFRSRRYIYSDQYDQSGMDTPPSQGYGPTGCAQMEIGNFSNTRNTPREVNIIFFEDVINFAGDCR